MKFKFQIGTKGGAGPGVSDGANLAAGWHQRCLAELVGRDVRVVARIVQVRELANLARLGNLERLLHELRARMLPAGQLLEDVDHGDGLIEIEYDHLDLRGRGEIIIDNNI